MKDKTTLIPHKSIHLSKILLFGSALGILALSGIANGTEADTAQNKSMLKGDWGQIKLNLRYRFEHVEQDTLKTANGDPMRLRLGYLSPTLAGFQAYGEFEGNTPVFANDFNDKSNGKTEYSVIADPAEGELNQAWLSYNTIPDTVLKAGRQVIVLDNQRFIGPVAWRQMEQSFDSVNIINGSLGAIDINASYIWNVRTILNADANMNSPILNMRYTFKGVGSLTAYGYWLDYDDAETSGNYANSSQTYGLRFTGKAGITRNLNLLYTAEYAIQSDYQKNPTDYTAGYYNLVGGLVMPGDGSLMSNLTGKVGYEIQESDNGASFKTPLGTNHAFSGWADLFLTTPADGLKDLYGMMGVNIAGIDFNLIYHDFQAETGGADYGSEVDLKLSKKFGKHYSVQTFYADYSADEYKVDTQKFWLQFTVNY